MPAPPCQRDLGTLGSYKSLRGERYARTKAQALVFEVNSILQLVVFRPLLSEEAIKETSVYAAIYMCKSSVPVMFNPLTPKDPYSGRTALLTPKRYILYIYSTNTGTEYFKHGIYCPFFLFKMQFVS